MKINFILMVSVALVVGCAVLVPNSAAQEMPREYADVLKALDKKGDFKDNVLKVNIPRSDLKITVDGVKTPHPYALMLPQYDTEQLLCELVTSLGVKDRTEH